MDNTSTCCILISTYNGEKYILEQLKSILEQKTSHTLKIYIRDDGSKDTTLNIIKKFAEDHSQMYIQIKEGENIGVQRSFLQLIKTAPDADYYAFCDQDDFWYNSKIEDAIRELSKFSIQPVLYYSNYEITDEKLNIISRSHIVEQGVTDSVTQILFHNRVPGCTMVFNKKLLDILRSVNVDMVRMHDAYVLAVAYLTGKVLGDNQYQIKYRQHSNNTVGIKKKFPGIRKWVKEKMLLLKYGENYSLSNMAAEILKSCSTGCSEKSIRELRRIERYDSHLSDRISLLFSPDTTSKTSLRSTLSIKGKIFFKLM